MISERLDRFSKILDSCKSSSTELFNSKNFSDAITEFNKIYNEENVHYFTSEYDDCELFCSAVSRLFVREIKFRATDRNSEIASSSIAEFLSNDTMKQEGMVGGYQVLHTLNLLSICSETMIDHISLAYVPSTMAKCIYIFLDLPKRDTSVVYHKFTILFKSIFNRLCSHSITVEEMCKSDSLRHCFLAMSDSCSKENSHWRVTVQNSLIAMSQNSLTPIVLDYIHSTQALVDCLKNLLQGHLSGPTVAAVFICLFHLLRESSQISKVLMDDFRSSGGYVLVSDFLLKFEEYLIEEKKPEVLDNRDACESTMPDVQERETHALDKEEIVFLLKDLLIHLGRLTMIGSNELRPKSGTTDQTFNLPGFILPQPRGTGFSIRNIQAFSVLQQVFIKACSEELSLEILDIIASLYKQDKANYFILAPQKTISCFADVIVNKSLKVQLQFFNLLVDLVHDLQYIPINEFSNVVLLLDNEKANDSCLTSLLGALSSLASSFSNFYEVFASLGVIELLLKHLNRIPPTFHQYVNDMTIEVFSPNQEIFFIQLLSFLSVCFENNQQLCELFWKQGGHEVILNLLEIGSVSTKSLSNKDQLIEGSIITKENHVHSSDDFLHRSERISNWISTLTSLVLILIKTTHVQSIATKFLSILGESKEDVQLRMMQSMFSIMRESKKFRTLFRKAQGFNILLSILSRAMIESGDNLKALASSQNKQLQEKLAIKLMQELDLIKAVMISINLVTTSDPANTWCLNNDIGSERVSSAMKNFCYDSDHTLVQMSSINLTQITQFNSAIKNYFLLPVQSLEGLMIDGGLLESIDLNLIEARFLIKSIWLFKLLFILSFRNDLNFSNQVDLNGELEELFALEKSHTLTGRYTVNHILWINVFFSIIPHITCTFPLLKNEQLKIALSEFSLVILNRIIQSDKRNFNIFHHGDVLSRILSTENNDYITILSQPKNPLHKILTEIFETLASFSITSTQFNSYLSFDTSFAIDQLARVRPEDLQDEFITQVDACLTSDLSQFTGKFHFISSEIMNLPQEHPLRREFYIILFSGWKMLQRHGKTRITKKINAVLSILQKKIEFHALKTSSSITRSKSFHTGHHQENRFHKSFIEIHPSYIDFDLTSEECSYLFLPSISPQQPISPAGLAQAPTSTLSQSPNTAEKIDLNMYGGVGSGERVFPPANGFTFTTWVSIERLDYINPVRLLNIQRGVLGMNEQMITLSIYVTSNGKQVVVETLNQLENNQKSGENQEFSLSAHVANDRPLEKTSTRAIFDFVGDPVKGVNTIDIENWPLNRWRHVSFVFSRAGFMKHSSCSLYIDGRPIGIQKLDYIQTTLASAPTLGQATTHKTSTVSTAVCAIIGTTEYDKVNSNLHWKQGPFYFIEEALNYPQILLLSTIDPNFAGNYQNVPSSPTMNDRLSPLFNEEKISFNINANTTTTMTLAKIARIYNQADAKIIARQMSLSAKENSTPIQILVNCASHLCGPARTLGGILIGDHSLKSRFYQTPVTRHISVDLALSFIAASSNEADLCSSMKILSLLIREGSGYFLKEMLRVNGYQLLKELIRKKKNLITNHVFEAIVEFCIMPPWFKRQSLSNRSAFCPQPVVWIQPNGDCPTAVEISTKSEIYYRQLQDEGHIESSPVHNSRSLAAPIPPHSIDSNIAKNENKCILNSIAFEEILLDFNIWIMPKEPLAYQVNPSEESELTINDVCRYVCYISNQVTRENLETAENLTTNEVDSEKRFSYGILIKLLKFLSEILNQYIHDHSPTCKSPHTTTISQSQLAEAKSEANNSPLNDSFSHIVKGDLSFEMITRIKEIMFRNQITLKIFIKIIDAIEGIQDGEDLSGILELIDSSVEFIISLINSQYNNAVVMKTSFNQHFHQMHINSLVVICQFLIWTLPKETENAYELNHDAECLKKAKSPTSSSDLKRDCLQDFLKVFVRNRILDIFIKTINANNSYNSDLASDITNTLGFEYLLLFMLPAHQLHRSSIVHAFSLWHLLIINQQYDPSALGPNGPASADINQDPQTGDKKKSSESLVLSHFRRKLFVGNRFGLNKWIYMKTFNKTTMKKNLESFGNASNNGFSLLLSAVNSKSLGSLLANCHEIFYLLTATMFGQIVINVPSTFDQTELSKWLNNIQIGFDTLLQVVPRENNATNETTPAPTSATSRFGSLFTSRSKKLTTSLDKSMSPSEEAAYAAKSRTMPDAGKMSREVGSNKIIAPEIGNILLALLRNLIHCPDKNLVNRNLDLVRSFLQFFQFMYQSNTEFQIICMNEEFIRNLCQFIVPLRVNNISKNECQISLFAEAETSKAIDPDEISIMSSQSDVMQYVIDLLKLIITDSFILPSEIHNPRHVFDSFINSIKDDAISVKDQSSFEKLIIREILEYLEMKEMMLNVGHNRLTATLLMSRQQVSLDPSLSFSPEVAATLRFIIHSNLTYLCNRLVDLLWHDFSTEFTDPILNFILKLLTLSLNLTADMEETHENNSTLIQIIHHLKNNTKVIWRSLNRTVLFFLSRSTLTDSDQSKLISNLEKVLTTFDENAENEKSILLFHNDNQDPNFVFCLVHLLIQHVTTGNSFPLDHKEDAPNKKSESFNYYSVTDDDFFPDINSDTNEGTELELEEEEKNSATRESLTRIARLTETLWKICYHLRKDEFTKKLPDSPLALGIESISLKDWSSLLEHPCIMIWADYMKKEAAGQGGSSTNDWGSFSIQQFKTNTNLANFLGRCHKIMIDPAGNESASVNQSTDQPKSGLTHQISLKFNRIGSTVFRIGPQDSKGTLTKRGRDDLDENFLDGKYKELVSRKNDTLTLETSQFYAISDSLESFRSVVKSLGHIENFLKLQIVEKNKSDSFVKLETSTEWFERESEMIRHRGIWGPENVDVTQHPDLEKYQLDTTEGPLRMRKKMIVSKGFYSRYFYNYFTSEDITNDQKIMTNFNISQSINNLRVPVSNSSLDYLLNFSRKKFSETDSGPLCHHIERLHQYLKILSDLRDNTPQLSDEAHCDTTKQNDDLISIEKSLNDTAKLLRDSGIRKNSTDSIDAFEIEGELDELLDKDEQVISPVGFDKEETDKTKELPNEQNQIVLDHDSSSEFYYLLPDNSAVLRLISPQDKIKTVSLCARVSGLEVHEGILCFGKNHFYLFDGFLLLNDRRIVDVDVMPEDGVYEPVVPLQKKNCLNTQRQFLKFEYSEIKEVHKRRYLLQQNAVEVFTIDGYNLLLALPKGTQNKIYQKFQHVAINSQQQSSSMLSNKGFGLSNLMGKKNMMQKWELGELTNFEYLMHLNSLAGRSYNDLMQYPIFPWVLADYDSEEIDFSRPEVFRDLKKPMGAIGEHRANQFKKRFKDWVDPDGETPPYHYSTHYSSAMIVASYLVRLEPFTQQFLKLQGGHFDLADRMFYSLKEAWTSASGQNMSDVKELIPEFFYLPDFLVNHNRFEFGKKQNGTIVDNVDLPPWAKNDPREFIRIHREALESDYVSAHLHHWIDLIFGYKQRGEAAINSQNVFHHLFYEGNVDIYSITDPIKRSHVIGFINNFGQIPKQLFKKPHPARKIPDYSKLIIPMDIPMRTHCSDALYERNQLDWSDAYLAGNTGCKYVAKLFYHNVKNLRPSLQILKELKHSVGQIVHIESGSLTTGLTVVASGALSSVVSEVSSHIDDITIAVSGSIQSTSPTSTTPNENSSSSQISQFGHVQMSGVISAVEQYKFLLPPNYTRYVSWGFNDGSLRIGNISDLNDKAQKIYENIDPGGQIMCTVAPTKDILITGGLSNLIKVWQFELNSNTVLDTRATQRTNPSLTGITYSSQESLKLLADLHGHIEPITCLAACNQFKIIVSGSADKTVMLWDLHRLKLMKVLQPKHKTTVAAISIHETNGDIVSVAGTHIHVWTLNGSLLATLDTFGIDPYSKVYPNNFNSLNKRSNNLTRYNQANILCCCMSYLMDWDVGNVVVTGHSDGVVRFWSLVHVVAKTDSSQRKSHSLSPDSTSAPSRTIEGKTYNRQIVFRGRLSYHHKNSEGAVPPSITSIAISKDHLAIFAGDSLGRVYGWFSPDYGQTSNSSTIMSNISSSNPITMVGSNTFSIASAGLISSIHNATVGKSSTSFGMLTSNIEDGSQNNLKCSDLNCSTKFSLTERKYHCRNCSAVFCSKCTKNQSQIYSLRIFSPVRVCNSCFEYLLIKQAPTNTSTNQTTN